MAQADGIVSNGSGSAVRLDINNQLAALFTTHSGATAPATTYPYQLWADENAEELKIRNGDNDGWVTLRGLDGSFNISDGTAATPSLNFSSDTNTGIFRHSADTIGFSTNATQRMIIGGSLSTDNGGPSLLWSTETIPVGTNVAANEGVQITDRGKVHIGQSSRVCLVLNRMTDTGKVASFQYLGTEEGSITVSSSGTAYNGAHLSRWSQLPGNAERIAIMRGTVLTNLNEMCEWGDENNEQLNRMEVSSVEGDVNVAGVFQGWDDDDDVYTNDFYCAMTGDFVIRIAQNTVVSRGDLLMSAGDGTAKPQGDDIVRSKTIAKVTSTTVSATYSDGSYCVPCVLMAC